MSKANREKAPLRCAVKGGLLTINIGVDTLAYAQEYRGDRSEWGIPTTKITDKNQFAEEVAFVMEFEDEIGQSPLMTFLDRCCDVVINQGSIAVEDIKHPKDNEEPIQEGENV